MISEPGLATCGPASVSIDVSPGTCGDSAAAGVDAGSPGDAGRGLAEPGWTGPDASGSGVSLPCAMRLGAVAAA